MDELKDLLEKARHRDAQASTRLVRMGAKALPAVIDALRGASLGEILPLSQIIQRMKDPEALPLLLSLLDDHQSNLRVAAFDALARTRDPHMLQPLVDRLDEYRHRALAIEAIGELGDPRGRSPLHTLAQRLFGGPPRKMDLSKAVAKARAEAVLSELSLLIRISTALAKLNDHSFSFIPMGLATFGFDDAAGPKDFTIRIEATWALRYVVGPGLFDTVLGALHDPEDEVRSNALETSLFLGAKQIVPEWIALVRGESPEIADLAWSYLHELTGEWPDGIKHREALDANQLEDWWQRRKSAFQEGVCYRLGKPLSPATLVPLLVDPSQGGFVREELRIITGVDFGPDESPLEWWVREQTRFESGKLYRYGFRHELAEVFQGG